jgi:deaminated glutathione amidase
MKIAALQMVSGTSVATNLQSARALLEAAAAQGCELALLPEHFALLGARDTDKLAIAEAYGEGPLQRFLADTARALGIWIAGGTLPLATADPQRVFNTALVFSPAGECVARYDKIHLFRFDNGRESFDEARVLERGAAPVLFDLQGRDGSTWRVGLSVCYDLRFPELYRAYAQAGADLLLVPSAFTHTTGEAHWEVLLRARAVENLAYVLAAGQGGMHENGRRTWGHSMLVDPWGAVLDVCPQQPGLATGTVDRARLAEVRRQLPALAHRVL